MDQYFNTFPKLNTKRLVLRAIDIKGVRQIFEIKNIPRPDLGFGNSIGNQTFTREYILSNPGLHIKYLGTSLRMKLYIESYFATIIKKNGTKIPLTIIIKKRDKHKHFKEITQLIDGKTVTKTILDNETIEGNQFLKNHFKHLRKLETGDKIVFMVKLSCSTCKPRFLPENIYITVGNDK